MNKIWQTVVVLACVVGYVVLAALHVDTVDYATVIAPIVGALFVATKLDTRSDAQDATLKTISENTNGVLTSRIRGAVTDAMRDFGIVAQEISTPPPAPASPRVVAPPSAPVPPVG